MKKFIPLAVRIVGLAISIYLTTHKEWMAIFLILFFLVEIVIQFFKLYIHFKKEQMMKEVTKMGGDAAEFKTFMNEFINEMQQNKFVADKREKK